ncbi:hypothetical protein HOLleu_06217 [Holothuria leucospilota]|uniref:Uncharacterized protein n=1 Tax=Holothuria leucospilota TaxID=206669 RepID=A0A9Q1CM76_HOLLE|nr:hypothetical protein HOLleu_06217 [Holothuria leucospilota]
MHMSFLAYPLSVLLFSPKSNRGSDPEPRDTLTLNKVREAFSTTFCLEVTSVSVRIIQSGKFSVSGNLNDTKNRLDGLHMMSPSSKMTSPWHMNSMEPPQTLTAEFLQHSSQYSKEGMIITSEALAQEAGTKESPETADVESKKVVFTCGHLFSKSSFLKDEVSKIEKTFASFPSKVSKSVDMIKTLYETESNAIPVACPQCVLDSLIQV